MRKSSVLLALFPAIRLGILRATLLCPKKWWFLSELARHLKTGPSSLQRELPALVSAGVLEERRDGARIYFTAQRTSPVYRSLRTLFEKASVPDESTAYSVSSILMSRYNREALHQEVWSRPLQRLAMEYGLSDSGLAKVCRKLHIPLPGRGYWNKKSAGKPVPQQPPLPPVAVETQDHKTHTQQRPSSIRLQPHPELHKSLGELGQAKKVTAALDSASPVALSPELKSRYNREELYEEVWAVPIQRLARKYGLSDVGLGKICRRLRIPLPGRGYWTKKAAGTPLPERPPLPAVAVGAGNAKKASAA